MRDIPGYEGLYAATDDGLIYSHAAGRCLSPTLINSGYYAVKIQRGGHRANKTVHSLVALAYMGARPTPKHQINHLDGVKTNNAPANLEYATRSENQKHAFRNGLASVPFRNTDEWASKIKGMLAAGMKGIDIAREMGTTKAAVSRIKVGKTYRGVA